MRESENSNLHLFYMLKKLKQCEDLTERLKKNPVNVDSHSVFYAQHVAVYDI